MASNFKNSAGTDLDSLFLVNNSNAGAIGFKMSDSTDLGNRYSNASTKLQQTIGYKNSAGTDIGYLRSNLSPTSSGSVTFDVYLGEVLEGEDYVYYKWLKLKNSPVTIDGVKFTIYDDDSVTSRGRFLYRNIIIYASVKVSNVTLNNISFSYTDTYSSWFYYKSSSTTELSTGTYTQTLSFTK